MSQDIWLSRHIWAQFVICLFLTRKVVTFHCSDYANTRPLIMYKYSKLHLWRHKKRLHLSYNKCHPFFSVKQALVLEVNKCFGWNWFDLKYRQLLSCQRGGADLSCLSGIYREDQSISVPPCWGEAKYQPHPMWPLHHLSIMCQSVPFHIIYTINLDIRNWPDFFTMKQVQLPGSAHWAQRSSMNDNEARNLIGPKAVLWHISLVTSHITCSRAG